MFPFWRVPEEVETFRLKPFLDSPLSWELNQKRIDWDKAPLPLGSHLKLAKLR